MNIIKVGNPEYYKEKGNDFYFKCERCECEWTAKRNEVKFTPPCMEFGVYMACPTCGQLTDYKKEN